MWDNLNKIAIIVTLLGIPTLAYGVYSIIYDKIIVYDMYREKNEGEGYTIEIGSFSRRYYKLGKKENENRQ